MNTSTTTAPKTVRELGDMAEAKGMKASELLEQLIDAGAFKTSIA